MVAPLLLRSQSPSPARAVSAYAGSLLFGVLAALFLMAAAFVWTAKTYGVDVAFLIVGVVCAVVSGAFVWATRRSRLRKQAAQQQRKAEIIAMLESKDDPVMDQIPEEWLNHPAGQTILAQIDDKPWIATLSAVGLGMALSTQLFDDI